MSQETKKWICTVCGYIHEGTNPPDCCPICGATSDLFDPVEESKPQTAPEAPDKWRCLNCEYVHEGAEPPGFCPVCGAPSDRFESYSEEPPSPTSDGKKQRIIIVGAGIAGISAAESIGETSPDSEITLILKEPFLPYYRLNLTRYLAGEIGEDDLVLYPQSWYDKNGIRLLLDTEMVSVEPEEKKIQLKRGESLPFDQLILTVGSHPFVPPFPGTKKENVTTLRTKNDADLILAQIKKPIRIVVIGGGLLGLETAGALAKQNADVTLLEGYDWLLPRQLNKNAAAILEERIAPLGIKIMKQTRTKEIVGDERVHGVLLEDGTLVPADLVIITTGVRTNSYTARLAGIDVNKGILVNNCLQTSRENIYAAGDVAEHQGVTYGTWAPSQYQGKIAGINAAGGKAEFAGIPRSNMLKVLGIDLFSLGQISGEDASYQIVDGTENGNYYYFIFRDNHMVGFILLGDTSLSGKAKHVAEKKTDCSPLLTGSVGFKKIVDFISRQ